MGRSRSLTSPLLTYAEAAELLGIAQQTLMHWVCKGMVPAVKLSPRAVRFRREDLEQLVEQRTVAASGAAKPPPSPAKRAALAAVDGNGGAARLRPVAAPDPIAEKAQRWVREALAGGPRRYADLKAAAPAAGFGLKTWRAAARTLGVQVDGYGDDALWRLP